MSKREKVAWLAVYLLTMAGVVSGIFALRQRTLAAMSTPEARAEWDAWRTEATKQSTEGPVRRRIPKSIEPPALVLMRDYFPIMLTGGVFFTTLLFIALAWAIRGSFAAKQRGEDS